MAAVLTPTTTEEILGELVRTKTVRVTTKRLDGKKTEVHTGPDAEKVLGKLREEIRDVSLRRKELTIELIGATTGDLVSAQTKKFDLNRGYDKNDPQLDAVAHDVLCSLLSRKHVIVESHNNRRRHI